LECSWDMYCHLPQNTDWALSSYKVIFSGIHNVEECMALNDTIPSAMLRTTMLFVMRSGIKPTWEDPQNKSGGSFSFKILNKTVGDVWKILFLSLLGETLVKNHEISKNVTGITISPKKNFCIVKIWMTDCSQQDVDIISDIPGIIKQKCLFRQHNHE